LNAAAKYKYISITTPEMGKCEESAGKALCVSVVNATLAHAKRELRDIELMIRTCSP